MRALTLFALLAISWPAFSCDRVQAVQAVCVQQVQAIQVQPVYAAPVVVERFRIKEVPVRQRFKEVREVERIKTVEKVSTGRRGLFSRLGF